MRKTNKTKRQLINVPSKSRQRTLELEKADTKCEQAGKEIVKSPEYFGGIYNSSKDGMGYADLEGVLLDVNDSFCKLTVYSRGALVT